MLGIFPGGADGASSSAATASSRKGSIIIQSQLEALQRIQAQQAATLQHVEARIAEQFVHDTPRDMWAEWRAIRCPLMVVRGEFSPLLSEATVERMGRIHPDMASVTAKGCGHAPLLDRTEQVTPIRKFLERSASPSGHSPRPAGWWQRLRHRLSANRGPC